MITFTLTFTLDAKVLLFQAIYRGKTKQTLPKDNFVTVFSLSANIKRHSGRFKTLIRNYDTIS